MTWCALRGVGVESHRRQGVLPTFFRCAATTRPHRPFSRGLGRGIIGDKSALPVVIDALGDYTTPSANAPRCSRWRNSPTRPCRSACSSKPAIHSPDAAHRHVPARPVRGQIDRPALLAGLKDAEPLVRAEAALSLGRQRAGKADLPALLRDSDEHVRGAAAYALGLIGDKDALRPILQDEAAFVRAIAAEALQKLGDKSAKPPDGFKAADLFTYPIYSPEHEDLYR